MPLCLSFLQDLLFYSFHIGVPCVCVCVCMCALALGGLGMDGAADKKFHIRFTRNILTFLIYYYSVSPILKKENEGL